MKYNVCSEDMNILRLNVRSGYSFGSGRQFHQAIRPVQIECNSVTHNSSIKHTSCMKVRFWVSSRRARVGASKANVPAKPGQS